MGWDADRSQFKTINRQHTCNANNSKRSRAITTRSINQRLHVHHNRCGMDVLSVITMGKLSANPTLTCANLVPNLVPTLCQAPPTRLFMGGGAVCFPHLPESSNTNNFSKIMREVEGSECFPHPQNSDGGGGRWLLLPPPIIINHI